MELDPIIPFCGKVDEFDLSVAVETEVVPAAKVYFSAAFPASYPIALNDGQVDHAFLIAQTFSSLDKNIPPDIAQPGKAVAGIALLGIRQGSKKGKKRYNQHNLSHFSLSKKRKARNMPVFFS